MRRRTILQCHLARRVSVPAAPGAKNAISCAVGAETHRAKGSNGVVGIIGLACLVVIAALAAKVAAEPVAVRGLVFVDANANGRRDAGEPGLANAVVSDGLSVHRTGADGRYAFEADVDPAQRQGRAPIIFVSVPSGFRAQGPWYKSAKDAGDLDFALVAEEQRLPFTFIHVTDVHMSRAEAKGKKVYDAFSADVEKFKDRAKFILSGGDDCDLGDSDPRAKAVADFERYVAWTAALPLPVRHVPGNHDHLGVRSKIAGDWDPKDSNFDLGLWHERLGPTRWSFNYAGYHFLGIEMDPSEPMKKWLKADLSAADGAPTIVLCHTPPAGYDALLYQRPVVLVLVGHYHYVEEKTQGRALYWIGGTLGGTDVPYGYQVVEVSKEGPAACYRRVGESRGIIPWIFAWNGSRLVGRGHYYSDRDDLRRVEIRIGDRVMPCELARERLRTTFRGEMDASNLKPGNVTFVAFTSDGEVTHTFETKIQPPKAPAPRATPAP